MTETHLVLQAFDGAIVAITHNKAFADNLRATHVLRVQVCSQCRSSACIHTVAWDLCINCRMLLLH